MDKKRQGEIALMLVMHKLFKSGLPGDGFHRDMGNVAKELKIDKEELREFYESILPELLRRMLGRKSVTLETSG